MKWTPPELDNGFPMISYRVFFKNYLKQLFEIKAYCDGSDPVIFASLECRVPLSVFKVSPFTLPVGELIKAQVEAANIIGFSTPSNDN